jgi:hypothetical protein
MDWEGLRLSKESLAGPARCYCGSRMEGGASVLRFSETPEGLTGLLEGRGWCTVYCARAELRDALHVLESAGSPDLLSDVQSSHAYLRNLLKAAQESARRLSPAPDVVPRIAPRIAESRAGLDALLEGRVSALRPRLAVPAHARVRPRAVKPLTMS